MQRAYVRVPFLREEQAAGLRRWCLLCEGHLRLRRSVSIYNHTLAL